MKYIVLSVIIPVYNVEPYLEEALRSVLNQNFEDMEIICVNDGSTDGSPAILEAFRKEDPRIRVIHQENHGLSAARNRGLKEAAGEFVYFFDSDDVLGERAFETLVSRMRRDSLDLLFFDVEPFFDEGIPEKVKEKYRKYYHREHLYEGVMTGTELLARQMKTDEFLVGVWAQVARRSFIEKNRLSFAEGLLYEDNLYTFQALLGAERAGYLNRAFFHRRLRAGSITQSKKRFIDAYSYFVSYMKMQEAYQRALFKRAQEEDESGSALWGPAPAELISKVLRIARSIYMKLDDAERRRAEELEGAEREAFSLHVTDYSRLNEQKKRSDRARKKAEVENAALKKEKDSLEKEKGKLAKQLEEIRGSKAYRFGKTVASPVRFLKDSRTKAETGRGNAGGQEAARNAAQEDAKNVAPEKQAARKVSAAVGAGKDGHREKTIWFFGSPSHGNLGDHMIAEASLQFLADRYPGAVIHEVPRDEVKGRLDSLRINIRPEDPIFYIGGGNLGNLWPANEEIRQEVIRSFPDNRIVILPQSIQYTDDGEGTAARCRAAAVYEGQRILVACRGRDSLDIAREYFRCPSVLAPDMVMYSVPPVYWRSAGPRKGVLLCLRSDKESALGPQGAEEVGRALQGLICGRQSAAGRISIEDRQSAAGRISVEAGQCAAGEKEAPGMITQIDMVQPHAIQPENRRAELAAMYRTISGAELVVTDRLHCMIFCAQTETPCVVLSNNHHKIRECYQWLEDLPYIRLIRGPEELCGAAEAVTAAQEREYPLRKLMAAFSDLSRMLGEHEE